MPKLTILLLLFFSASFACGQTDTLSNEDRLALDSMFKNDEFIKLMYGKPKSYFDINAGIGNGIFSLRNNQLNAGQAETEKIFYTGSAGYNHKSGFAIAFNAFMSSDNGSLKIYQYALNPSYYYGKNINAGISYTRFIKGSVTSFDVSPFKNDLYGNIVYKKTWIEPGLAIGYSTGKIVEYLDTSFWFYPPPPSLPRVIHLRDTITTKLRSVSVTLSASHKWNFFGVMSRSDAIRLQPSLLLNGGSHTWTSTNKKQRLFFKNYFKRMYGDGISSESFKFQSLAFLAELTYYYNKFYFQPLLYLDYYLPSTTEKRLTTVFSVVAGFTL